MVNHQVPLSIIMPIYKVELSFLKKSLLSLEQQTYPNFEVLIICDDNSKEIHSLLDDFHKADERFNVFYTGGIGFTHSLNYGIKKAKGEYIARMDGDDISNINRFEKQISFLSKNSEIGICGTWFTFIDKTGKEIRKIQFPCSDILIRWHMLFYDCIGHPTVMMRSNLFQLIGYYNEDYSVGEDYELWSRMLKYTKIANIPEYLLEYRIHGANISICNNFTILENNYKIRKSQIIDLLNQKSERTDDALKRMIIDYENATMADIREYLRLITTLFKVFTKKNKASDFELECIKSHISKQFLEMAILVKKYSILCGFLIFIKGFKYSKKLIFRYLNLKLGVLNRVKGIFGGKYDL